MGNGKWDHPPQIGYELEITKFRKEAGNLHQLVLIQTHL